jgi:hypothetical protein
VASGDRSRRDDRLLKRARRTTPASFERDTDSPLPVRSVVLYRPCTTSYRLDYVDPLFFFRGRQKKAACSA